MSAAASNGKGKQRVIRGPCFVTRDVCLLRNNWKEIIFLCGNLDAQVMNTHVVCRT